MGHSKKKSGPEVVIVNGSRKQTPPKAAPPAIFAPASNSVIPEVLLDKVSPAQRRELQRLENGLADVIGFGSGGFPGNQGTGWSSQLSSPDTIFYNLRWFLVSNFRQMLSEAYMEIGLIQTICIVPVEDALRGGVTITSKQLSPEQVEELQVAIDRDNILTIVGEAAIWNRLYGGAGILTLVGDQAPDEPLDLKAIGPDTELEFRAVDMWEIFWSRQGMEGYDPTIQSEDYDYYNYYGFEVHKSRLMRLKGIMAPSFIRPRLRGWGVSVVETLVRSINQYLKATDLTFELADEFKLDVYKIKNLTDSLVVGGEQENAIKMRVAMANWQKNYQHAVVMDSEDDFDHKQISFAGISEMMEGIRIQIASDMRMPISKLFGTGSKGFSNGEDDIEVYNAMVESQVRNKIKYDILRILEIKCQQLFGFIPDDISITFKSLRTLSSTDEEGVKTQKFTRLLQAKERGEISTREFRDGCNVDRLLPIQLNPDLEILEGDAGGMAADDDGDPYSPTDVDDPGADRQSKKAKSWEKGGMEKGAKGKQPSNVVPFKDPSITNWREASVQFLPEPYTRLERVARRMINSAAFDRASYRADGGDGWIDPRRKYFFENPRNVEWILWDKAGTMAREAFGSNFSWQSRVWFYRKMGGKFGEISLQKEEKKRYKNSWKESDHPRDEGGKFSESEREAIKKELLKKRSLTGNYDIHSVNLPRKDAITKAKALRAEGIAAFIHHLDGPRTGPKSKYVVTVSSKHRNSVSA